MPTDPSAVRGVPWRALGLLALVAVVVWLADWSSKEWVIATMREGERRAVLGEFLTFHFVRNPGAAFSIASGMTWIFTILASAVAIGIVVVARRLRSFAWAAVLGVILAGVTGNLFDRLTRPPGAFVGHVIDFLSVWGFPAIFNVADIAICTGMAAFMILVLRGVRLDGTRKVEPAPEAAADAEAVAPRER